MLAYVHRQVTPVLRLCTGRPNLAVFAASLAFQVLFQSRISLKLPNFVGKTGTWYPNLSNACQHNPPSFYQKLEIFVGRFMITFNTANALGGFHSQAHAVLHLDAYSHIIPTLKITP